MNEKIKALSLLMKRQAGVDITFNDEQAKTVCVYKIVTNDFSGKRKPQPAK